MTTTTNEINTLSILNGLIASCGGSHYGFSAASAEETDPGLKALFTVMKEQRAVFMHELQDIAAAYGGADSEAVEMEAASGRWKSLQEAVTNGDSTKTLEICMNAEQSAADTYKTALHDKDIPENLISIAKGHLRTIDQTREKLKYLHDQRVRQLGGTQS